MNFEWTRSQIHLQLLLPMFLPLPCLRYSLLHLLTRSTLSLSVAVVMEMPQTSWGISKQNSGVQGLVRWVSVGVGSQWGLSFYRPQWRQNLLGKAIKPAALCVFECRLVGQSWPFNLTKLKEMTSSTCLQGCRFSVIFLSFFCSLWFWKNLLRRNDNERGKAMAHLMVFFCKAHGLTKVRETRGRTTPKSQKKTVLETFCLCLVLCRIEMVSLSLLKV